MSRIEAAVKAWDRYWGDRYGDDALEEMGDEVKVALEAADAFDAANQVHRVSLDEGTVERVAEALAAEEMPKPLRELDQDIQEIYRRAARSALAAAVKEDGE